MNISLIIRIGEIIIPVLAIIILGYVFGRAVKPDMRWVNRLALDVLGPLLIFSALAGKDFDIYAHTTLITASLAIVVISGLIAWPFAKLLRADGRTFVPPMMFNNCGNMGVPLAIFAFGPAALGPFVVLVCTSNLLHFTVGAYMVNHKADLKGVLKSPMIIATLAGLAYAMLKLHMPEPIYAPIKMLGDAAIPIMLLALGVRLNDVNKAAIGLSLFGAALCPLTGFVAAGFLKLVLPMTQAQWQLVLLFAALPPAVLNFLVAERYQQEPAKVASICLVGNIAALFFVPIALLLAMPK
jgi:malate permease and related proteins